MPVPILQTRVNRIVPAQGSAGPPPPEPTVFEELGAVFRTTEDDVDVVQEKRIFGAYGDVEQALVELGVDREKLRYDPIWSPFGKPKVASRVPDKDAIWAALDSYRQSDPSKFTNIPKTREEFERGVLNRYGRAQQDQQVAGNANIGTRIVGGMAGSFTDPFNVLTLPIGAGGKTIGQVALREGILNAGLEGYQQFDLAASRRARGEELTGSEVAMNVVTAGLGGAVLGGAGKYVGNNFDAIKSASRTGFDAIKSAPRAAQEVVWAKMLEASPALRGKVGGKMDWDAIDDDMLPDLAEGIIGRDNLSEAESDAIAVIRREADIDRANPFIPDGAGIAAHREGLAAAMERIFGDLPASAPRAVRPALPRSPAAPREGLRGSTAISSGTVAGGGYDPAVLKSLIRGPESGGNDNVVNRMGSSASGRYQFVSGTFKDYYQKVYGGSRADADAAWRTSRFKVDVQEKLMDRLMADNAATLRRSGVAVDNGNMYVLHVLGGGNGPKLLRAAPDTPVAQLLSPQIVAQNPSYFGKGRSVSESLAIIRSKVGGRGDDGVAARGDGSSGVDGVDPDIALRDELNERLADIDKERADLDNEPAPAPRLIMDEVNAYVDRQQSGEFRDAALIDAETRQFGEAYAPQIQAETLRRAEAAPPVTPRINVHSGAEVDAMLPALRKLVRAREVSLNEPAKLADALGVDEALLRLGLFDMVAGKELRLNKKGVYSRPPSDNGPVDILKFVARSGGLSVDGLGRNSDKVASKGHGLGAGGRDWHKEFVPGAGRIIQKNGRGIDDIGELLHEAGYFGDPSGPRPSESDVLNALDIAVQQKQKIYPFGQSPEARQASNMRDPWRDDEDRFHMQSDFDNAADDIGVALDDEAFESAARLYAQGGYDSPSAAIVDMINREIEADQAAKYYEAGDAIDERQVEEFLASAQEAGFDVGSGRGGPEILAGDTGAVGKAGGDVGGDIAQKSSAELEADLEPPYFDQGALRAFDDPDGAAATDITDSLEHDLRAEITARPQASSPVKRPAYSPADDAVPLNSPKETDLWLLSDDELEQLEINLRAAEIENVRRAIGDDLFEQYKKITSQNRKNDWLDDMDLDDRQMLLIYGRQPDPRASADDVSEIRSAIGSIAPDDDQAYIVGQLIASLGKLDRSKIEAVNAGNGTANDQTHFITFRNAVAALEMQGVARRDVPDLVGRGYEDRGIERADAEYMMESLFGAPDAAGPVRQADGIEHDLRALNETAPMTADMFGGATAAEKRAALERKGDGGLSNDVEQKPVGSDGGLFDPDAQAQTGFRMDEEGEAVNPADLLAEIDAEAAMIKDIKDCL